ncbi:thiol peroxidase [uncultured Enterococcus sp.]|uniref:thiol peroxidase n=1 Tax=uncultured Enterococcus sp. TaxID=167972 RepID=UPI002613C672|nr:thiol peroxidase [uncultured Enterococcus sp.]
MQITKRGEAFSLVKEPLKIGDQAADFELEDLKGKVFRLFQLLDKPLIISVVPDINTSVCSVQTRKFNEMMANFEEANFVTVSNNTKEQQASWCAAEGLNLVMLHDPENTFGQAYGVLIPELNVYARSVFVINSDGKIIYEEIVPEMTHEPDYQKAIDAVTHR